MTSPLSAQDISRSPNETPGQLALSPLPGADHLLPVSTDLAPPGTSRNRNHSIFLWWLLSAGVMSSRCIHVGVRVRVPFLFEASGIPFCGWAPACSPPLGVDCTAADICAQVPVCQGWALNPGACLAWACWLRGGSAGQFVGQVGSAWLLASPPGAAVRCECLPSPALLSSSCLQGGCGQSHTSTHRLC